MPSLSLLIHVCLVFFAGFTVYKVQQNDFLTSLRFIGQQTSEFKPFHLKVLELPAPTSQKDKVHCFVPLQNIRNESSLPRQDNVHPVQKYRVEEEWHKYCCVTRSIPEKIDDALLKKALSVEVKPTKSKLVDLIISLMVVLGLWIVLIRLRLRTTLAGMLWNVDNRSRIANLVHAFLQRAVPGASADLPVDASFLSLYHFLSPHYKVKSKLGNGAFGAVYRAFHLKSSKEVAIKFSTSNSYAAKSVMDEGCLMKQLTHENILRVLHTYYADETAALVMELMDGTLSRLNGNKALTAGHLAVIFRQLLIGLDYMHQKNVIHRDIKSHNILINNNGQIKLADFGLAVSMRDVPSQFGCRVGTINWMAPEMLARRPYNKKVDIWSLGVVLIELIDGKECYSRINDKEKVFTKIMKYGAVSKKVHRFGNPYLEDFLSDMLTFDPSQRPSARDLLCHPFLQMFAEDEEQESLVSLLEGERL